jgi:hypothetical protein
MGDGSDYTDIERFMNSDSGKEHLNIIRRSLIGRTIADLQFENNTQNVKTLMILENGGRFYAIQPCHDVNVVRELFGDAIEREGANILPAAAEMKE